MHEGTPFDSTDDYIALPRLSGLALSPDGRRLVVGRAALGDDRTEYTSALWEIDVTGASPARRLTWGSSGESGASFTSDGDLLFTAKRTATRGAASDDVSALWRLPAGSGEAIPLVRVGGGVTSVVTARSAPAFVFTSKVFGTSLPDDERIRAARREGSVSAVLHTGYPVRHWDADLGADVPHLLTGESDPGTETCTARDLSPAPGDALREADVALSPDGTFVVCTWTVGAPGAARRTVLCRIDVASGARTVLADDPVADLGSPAVAPDGGSVAYLRESWSTPDEPPHVTLHRLDLESGTTEQLAVGWDRWPTSVAWTADGADLVVTADERGRGPVFVVPRQGEPRAVTHDDHTYSDVRVAPDGSTLFALRASYLAPPHPVRIDLGTGSVAVLRAPDERPELPGTLVEVETLAPDGHPLRAWLALPTGAQPHAPVPMLLWIHGGPLSSWNTWSWRWNPWLLVAQGYAVLLPDPALSTGYGQDFVRRGWGRWGKEPFTDLMALTDAATERAEIDGARIGAMGGSFGGYMANWVAGHTNRFSAIVTHASLWALDQFGPTTDAAWYWAREMTPEMAVENSPHLFVADISTPMLVIHGDKDYRVPIGEGLRLWYELLSESGLPADDAGVTAHRFLYFPTENHWVLAPQHTKLWYEVVAAFLSEHVLGESAAIPDVLG
ncbi:S9 family peptidase [Rhodococcus rhodnii]|uniref:Dipeptidyl aminopeptidase n=2 Tax=Rhodococcus rhodnii TaxID=38312 RepID=R7WMA3_9NOCA|nr:alpha/beta fold hydrolase [Rhodococcus rhodnii]EOM76446.1 dipeptidyl aminopeptidase [Rhodococcus rhodnii LMG 5362]TXG91559.1 S9 family peptidase [Rhodococcus rhodnii]